MGHCIACKTSPSESRLVAMPGGSCELTSNYLPQSRPAEYKGTLGKDDRRLKVTLTH
jgi:hypothetical protein